MKVKDAAMGKWFQQLTPPEAIKYIFECLYKGRSNVFWDIVEYHNLKANSGPELAVKVYENLYEFEMNADEREELEE